MGRVSTRAALIALAHCVEPGDVRLGAWVERVGVVQAAEALDDGSAPVPEGVWLRWRAGRHVDAEGTAAHCGARIVVRGESEWPSQLADLGPREPYALWVVGAAHLRLAAVASVAVVGARACTGYGVEVAHGWSASLAASGVTVVSGGAFGIDAAAHRGALAAGLTVCVVAGGVNVPYPRSHDALLARIADEGLVVSESPPDEQVRRQRFLTRNRVIAALTRATLVVEAAERSGTASTAREAHTLGRVVAAVPGPVTSATSAGCHRMVRDREAELALSADDVRMLAGLANVDATPAAVVPGGGAGLALDGLDARARRVHDALPARRAVSESVLMHASGLSLADMLTGLALLELNGLAMPIDGGWRAVRPARREAGTMGE